LESFFEYLIVFRQAAGAVIVLVKCAVVANASATQYAMLTSAARFALGLKWMSLVASGKRLLYTTGVQRGNRFRRSPRAMTQIAITV
jgi:hypothetical protein